MTATLDDRSDEELMALYVGGEEQAFRVLFERYGPRLLRAVRRQVRSEEDATEIVQQTFLQLHRARFDFQQGRLLRPWVFTICFNLRREHFRRKARRPEAPLDLDGRSDPAIEPPDLTRPERARQLREAVARLPSGQREVIELHWFDDLPFKEVALIVGASLTAVKVRAHRGYGRLRTMLEEEDAREDARIGGNPLPSSAILTTESDS